MLSFLDIWTTPLVDPTTAADNTITIRNARYAAIGWAIIGVVTGPWIHRTLNVKPLI